MYIEECLSVVYMFCPRNSKRHLRSYAIHLGTEEDWGKVSNSDNGGERSLGEVLHGLWYKKIFNNLAKVLENLGQLLEYLYCTFVFLYWMLMWDMAIVVNKEKDTPTNTLSTELSDLNMDASVYEAWYVIVIDRKLSSKPSLHFLSFSDILRF